MSPIVSEILLSGFMINSTLRRRTHLFSPSPSSSSTGSTSSREDPSPVADRPSRSCSLLKNNKTQPTKPIDNLSIYLYT
ncbi:unnamed protein product [Spirodela intermedia]|uniref:Uncharacterized protein n=1 Tax=Spirodela intermedia TaxID=51605 RepID=A0ABN7EBN6_SPIIN|nr:unnamed protein product [Spirodela intermedia]